MCISNTLELESSGSWYIHTLNIHICIYPLCHLLFGSFGSRWFFLVERKAAQHLEQCRWIFGECAHAQKQLPPPPTSPH